ncbi:MAG: BBP7 family outer membrane beta-barrel protein, partial [Planctomycetaceae bacterium]
SDEAQGFINLPDLQAGRFDPDDLTIDTGVGTVDNPNVIIPLLTDGQPGSIADLRFIGFDRSYRAAFRSQFWGAELNVLSEPQSSVNPLTWQWLGGFRYFNYDERFNQFGEFDNGGGLDPRLEFNLRSSTTNNSYGPTVVFRTQFVSKYLTLSMTPRVSFALNDYTTRYSTFGSGFAAPGADPTASTLTRFVEDEIDFTTITQVTFLAELHLTESFTLFGGYDFFWSYRAARSFNQTTFGSNVLDTGEAVPDITANSNPESLAIEGLSFGATFRF